MGGHRQRQIGQRLEGGKVGVFQRGAGLVDQRGFVVAVLRGAAMAGQVLDDGQHTARQQPFGQGAGMGGHLGRRGAHAAVAQEGMGLRPGQIGAGGIVAVDARGAQFGRQHPPCQGKGGRPGRGQVQHRRVVVPARRAQALDPAAFLIDEHRRVMACGFAQRACQAAQLVGAFDIAGKQRETPGPDGAEQRQLVRGGKQPVTIQQAGRKRHRVVTGMQRRSGASTAAQKRRLSSSVSKPCTRSR